MVLAACVACPPAHALVSLNDGHDKVYVSASVSVAADSNIFARSNGGSDTVYSTTLAAEYQRRAGWIGVHGNIGVASSKFARFTDESFANPTLGVEFTKQTGRTTGSLNINAARESRAESAVGVRTDSWNYNASLNFKYPIVAAYTLTGAFGYSNRKYVDETLFASLATYSATFDLMHIISNERELVAGYRYRYSETSRLSHSEDHGLSLGLSGRIIRGVMGNVRLGYQTRSNKGFTLDPLTRAPIPVTGKFTSWTSSASAVYAINKKMNVTGGIVKDFSTTAADTSIDTLTATLDTAYTFSSHLSVSGNVAWGRSRFLGENGRIHLQEIPVLVLGPQREDDYVTWGTSLNYSLNEHLKASLTYAWFENWSNAPDADFIRSSWTLTVSTRW